MSQLNLSASAHAFTSNNYILLVISVTDGQGVPVLNVKRQWISVSHVAIRTAGYAFVKLLVDQFSYETDGFYSMRLKPNPQQRFANSPFPGDQLLISVKKVGLAKAGTGGIPVLEEGYITISST